MTQEEKRIKIAEACGWRMVEGMLAFPPLEWVKARIPADVFESLGCVDYTQIPDYFNDLNACHEAEGTLSEFQHHHFAHWLHHDLGHKSVSAPPAIRAECLGITLGLWKEGD